MKTPPLAADDINAVVVEAKMDTFEQIRRLNIGCGTHPLEGFVNIDRRTGQEAFPLKYTGDFFDEIRASHILEHFAWREIDSVMREWVRVLKPGGLIKIAVPDVSIIAKRILDNPRDHVPYFNLMGGQIDDNDFHRSAFTEGVLRAKMELAGLIDITTWPDDGLDTAKDPCSLRLMGYKPKAKSPTLPASVGKIGIRTDTSGGGGEQLDIKIAAMMSVPRYGSLNARGIIDMALRPFKIPLRISTGVFWGQCMQRMFQAAVDENLDWILTIDYDSLFTDKQVSDLMVTFGRNPHIDALAALQCRRHGEHPLMIIAGQAQTVVTGAPIKVDTAHFGLTLIRVEALRKMNKPWFHSITDKSGGWGDGRVDDDIYFWHRWRDAGLSLYVDPACAIGHEEECVSYLDDDMRVQRCAVHEWRKMMGLTK